ncbi:NlpC/P60 family protein [Amycolatopsis sp. NPDC047767]|uniref:C40 family peptidase n=1 Tax=Amycolatopsis sp. NPDC047767 TaxID=3156765 RepID=UPI003454922F
MAAIAVTALIVIGFPLGAIGMVVLSTQRPDEHTGMIVCSGGGPGGGTQPVDRQLLDASSMDIARTIVDVVRQRRLPRRAAALAIATGLVESGLHNLDHGDRDSLGVFQQRPSQGWGMPAQILNPVYATNSFLNHLVALTGWATMPPGVAEQAVQRSAFPGRYAPREQQASDLVAKFWSGPDNPVPPSGGGLQPVSATPSCPDHEASNLPVSPGSGGLPPGFTYPSDASEGAAVRFAVAQVGKRYVWGGKGPDVYDCSGLMLAAWAAAGVAVPAGTLSQVRAGHAVADAGQLLPGDLLFIAGALGTAAVPRHVGMYAGNGVVVDAYDEHHGVILEALADWTRRIVAIRRVADPATPSPSPGGSQHG